MPRAGEGTQAARSLTIVTYDISDDSRRTKMAQLLLRYGARVEASVYELWLTARQIEKMWHDLTRLTREGDLVRCYIMCETCARRVRSVTLTAPKDAIAFFA